jgi:hypothetical protein
VKPPEWSDVPRNGCLAACIAAVLERPVTEIPCLVGGDEPWEKRLIDWAHSEGLVATFTSNGKTRRQRRQYSAYPEATGFPPGYFIAILAPHTEGKAHAVVMKGSEVVYDPGWPRRRRYQKRGISMIELTRQTFVRCTINGEPVEVKSAALRIG